MPFALNTNASPSEISEALNYLLGNFGNGSTVDPVTGQIIAPGGIITGYLYQYMAVKYADSADGSVNFSNSPTNRLYFGLRNSSDAAESSNYADYIWYQASGGFGTTKFLWYQTTGGRQLQVAVSVSAPDAGWIQDTGSSIDLDIITSGTIPVVVESFATYFTPPVLQVPRTGNPLAPVFTYVTPALYATDKGEVIPFSDAQTDTGVTFTNNTWRIGNSSTTGYGDISKTNITIGDPTDSGDFALWPAPTAMSNANAFITVPIRYKNSLGDISQASVATQQLVFVDPGATGLPGPTVDISGYASFTQNAGGLFTPPNATLSAITTNISVPTYSWAITGATPSSATTSSVVVTPLSASTAVTVTLTVGGSNITGTISKTITMPVVYDGAPGTAGANGVMSAFPTIYIWTGSSTPPTRPSTTSTFTWSTGTYTAPSGWSSQAPSNTTAGNYLWSITIPLNVSATTTTSTLDWTNVAYPIRAIAYNGANGANGTNGTNGTNGIDGAATFVVTRTANDSSAPTNAEVNAVLGRDPVAGDIVTVSYNSANNAVVYRFITTWTLFQTYITGSLIVENTITASKLSVTSLNSITASTGTLNVSGTITANTASLSGSTLSGDGAVIYSNGKFGVGNATNSLVWDNSSLIIKGDITGSSNIDITGDASFKGQDLSADTVIVNGIVYYIDSSAYAEAITLPTTDTMRVGFYGYANASPNLSVKPVAYNVGVLGEGKNKFGAKGYGVVGLGDEVGGYFEGAGYGVIANGSGIVPIGIAIAGKLNWGIYSYPAPTGSTTQFLRNDGTWAVPAGGGGGSGTVTSVSTSGTVSGLTLTGGPITTSGTITLGGSLVVAASDITSGTIATARLGTGTANTTTFLRGDNTWSASTNNFGLSPSSGTGFANTFAFFTGGTGITVTGNGTDRLTFATTSDVRLKYDINFDDQDYKTVIPALKIAKYKRNDKGDYKPGDYIEYGTTAQSTETVCSYLVDLTDHQDAESIKAVNYQSIFSMNVKYTQYLQEQVDALKAEIEALKAKVA